MLLLVSFITRSWIFAFCDVRQQLQIYSDVVFIFFAILLISHYFPAWRNLTETAVENKKFSTTLGIN